MLHSQSRSGPVISFREETVWNRMLREENSGLCHHLSLTVVLGQQCGS